MIDKIQIVHKDVKASLERMPYESVGRLFMALLAYANDEDYEEIIKDDASAYMYFPTLQGHVNRMEESRTSHAGNGAKGGAPVGNQNARKTTKNNLKQPKTSENNQKQTPNLTLPIPKPINKRHYGECANVLLSDEEYEKIKSQGLTNLIDELSFYIASKGDKYKSHYAVIRQWANRREKEKVITSPMSGQNAKNQFNRYTQRTDYDFEALEKKLIKN